MFNNIDIIACEKILARRMPRKIVEIGAGYSTSVFLSNTPDDCKIISIEPYPSAFLKTLAQSNPSRITLNKTKIQDFKETEVFSSLEAGDILFIDSTHVCNIGGDLPDIFARILPSLRQGVVVHVHDVMLPYEYSAQQACISGRLYNEQYLLAPLIAHRCYQPLFGTYRFLFKRGLWLNEGVERFINRGTSLWMTKL